MAQLTQSAKYDTARAGEIEGGAHLFTIDGRHLASGAAFKAGTFVSKGATDGLCKPPTTSGEVTATGLGFAMFDAAKGANGTANEYAITPEADAVPIVTDGPGIWCIAEETVAFGDPVFVVFNATNRGQVRNDADTGRAAQLPGCRVEKYVVATDGTKLALVSVSHPAA